MTEKLSTVMRCLLHQVEGRMCQPWEQSGEPTCHRLWEGIELRASKQLELEASGKADRKEAWELFGRESPYMSRIGPHLGWLHAAQECQAVVEGADVRHANDQRTPKAELERDLVADPEELLDMFEHLVRDEEIHAVICHGQLLAFQIEAVKFDPVLLQYGLIRLYIVNADQVCPWKVLPDKTQIMAGADA